jgi:hypothetical protein
MTCACPVAGWCTRYRRTMTPRQHQICQGNLLSPEKCRAMRDQWARQGGFGTPLQDDCQQRGLVELRRELCVTCKNTTLVKVFACAVHGECTLGQPLAGTACCRHCNDYAAGGEILGARASASTGPLADDHGFTT